MQHAVAAFVPITQHPHAIRVNWAMPPSRAQSSFADSVHHRERAPTRMYIAVIAQLAPRSAAPQLVRDQPRHYTPHATGVLPSVRTETQGETGSRCGREV